VDAWHARYGGSILAVRGGDPPSGCDAEPDSRRPRWSCYYGAFDDGVAEIGRAQAITKYNATDPGSSLHFHHAFAHFMDRRTKAAEFALQTCSPDAGDRGRVVKTVTYPGMFLNPKLLYVIRRDSVGSESP
jgi:hypothetical protein